MCASASGIPTLLAGSLAYAFPRPSLVARGGRCKRGLGHLHGSAIRGSYRGAPERLPPCALRAFTSVVVLVHRPRVLGPVRRRREVNTKPLWVYLSPCGLTSKYLTESRTTTWR